jgi:hypothetical protein
MSSIVAQPSDTTPVQIVQTTDEMSIKISPKEAIHAKELYFEACKRLAEEIFTNKDKYGCNASVEELIAKIPQPVFEIKSRSKKKPKVEKASFNVTNWKECEDKEQLGKSLKSKDLKDILSANSLPISGTKSELLDRVWGITHPDEAPELPKKKKRGGKKKTKVEPIKNHVDVEDSDDDKSQSIDNLTDMIEKGNDIKIKTHTVPVKLVESKGWIFLSNDEELEFLGQVEMKDGKISIDEEGYTLYNEIEPPQELLDLFDDE